MFKKSTYTAAVTAVVAMAGTLPAGASAGQYHVYSCRTPAGSAAPADGWAPATVGTFTAAENTCAQPDGGLVASLGEAARNANAASSSWTFTVPSGERLANAVLWRAGDADGGAAVNAFYEFWIGGPEDVNSPANVFDQCVAGATCPSGVGTPAAPQGPENRVVVPPANLGGHIYVNAACEGVSTFKCKEGQGDTHGFAAVVYLYAADLTLEQSAGPTAGSVGGELASAATISGTSDITFQASDAGAGVYQAQVTVDGVLRQVTQLDENGGRCVNIGQTTDGLPAFLYLQPCAASVSADVGLDTTRLSDGTHHVVVTVTDAAGNSATVLDRNVVVANATSAPGSGAGGPGAAGAGSAGAGAPNGTNASSQASLTVAWRNARGPRLATGFGRSETAQGRLLAPGGVPISGAQIEVLATPSAVGARTTALASPHTAADGTFALRLAPGASSRTLMFAYRAHLGDPQPVATGSLTLAVRAALSLSISPHTAHAGSTIRFSGRLLGGPVPGAGKLLVLEARSGRGGWIKFDVVRSDRRGRYRARYRFRFPGPVRYSFRVVSEPEGDYPYSAGSSNTVVVNER